MEWNTAKYDKEEDQYAIPNSWLFIYYYDALNTLFRVENSLRVFVYSILKKEFQNEWSNINISTEDEDNTTINAIARKRKNQAKSFGYIGFDVNCPIMHLTSGELIRLITSDSYWKFFARYFKGSKDIIKYKLDEIGNIRNSLAHFRPIKIDDVELIKQNSNHVLLGIEDCLSEMLSTNNAVPTNSQEEWYLNLSTIGSEHCSIRLFQSNNEEWVRVQFYLKSEMLDEIGEHTKYHFMSCTNFITPAIISQYPNLAKFIIYLAESIVYSRMDDDLIPKIHKQFYLLFNIETIEENHEEIKNEITNLVMDVESETELIEQDNLAKGEIIEVGRFNVVERDDSWEFNTRSLENIIDEEHPVEYWGVFGTYHRDFITKTERYPWMPSDISHMDLPF